MLTTRISDFNMKLIEMNTKVQEDLGGIPLRRAKGYVNAFHKSYNGRLEAITAITARYTDDGLVEISYIINGKESIITIGKGSLYAEEIEQRKKQNQLKRYEL